MNILHVITGLQKAAGTSVFVAELSNELVANGQDVTIAVCNPNTDDQCPLDSRISLISISSLLSQTSQHYNSTTSQPDLVHIHALWSPILHKVSFWAHKNKIPVVWSPHGMLQKWALKNKWWKKFSALALYQWRDLRKADLLHATAESEVEDIRRIGLKNRVVVAPLGVRVRSCEVVKLQGCEVVKVCAGKRTLLFVSRVQRKKGLPVLIEAWSRLPIEVKDGWRVRIVGPDQGNHTAELKEQCERCGVRSDFDFVGPKYGEELDAEYRAADLFVLPTHSENFGSVVIEALARGVPVICSKGAPWQELETHQCGWWPDDSVDALTETLKVALTKSADVLQEMGKRGRKLVNEKYTWKAVSKMMAASYNEILKFTR